MPDPALAARRVHQALRDYLGEDELAVSWCLVIDVAHPRGRYLAHRGGGGHDGDDAPTLWAAIGMFEAASAVARQQLLDTTEEPPPD